MAERVQEQPRGNRSSTEKHGRDCATEIELVREMPLQDGEGNPRD